MNIEEKIAGLQRQLDITKREHDAVWAECQRLKALHDAATEKWLPFHRSCEKLQNQINALKELAQ